MSETPSTPDRLESVPVHGGRMLAARGTIIAYHGLRAVTKLTYTDLGQEKWSGFACGQGLNPVFDHPSYFQAGGVSGTLLFGACPSSSVNPTVVWHSHTASLQPPRVGVVLGPVGMQSSLPGGSNVPGGEAYTGRFDSTYPDNPAYQRDFDAAGNAALAVMESASAKLGRTISAGVVPVYLTAADGDVVGFGVTTGETLRANETIANLQLAITASSEAEFTGPKTVPMTGYPTAFQFITTVEKCAVGTPEAIEGVSLYYHTKGGRAFWPHEVAAERLRVLQEIVEAERKLGAVLAKQARGETLTNADLITLMDTTAPSAAEGNLFSEAEWEYLTSRGDSLSDLGSAAMMKKGDVAAHLQSLYDAYVNSTESPLPFADWLSNVYGPSIEDPEAGVGSWAESLWDGIKWLGGAAVDTAKELGPVGTGLVGLGIGGATGLIDSKWLWIGGGVLALAALT